MMSDQDSGQVRLLVTQPIEGHNECFARGEIESDRRFIEEQQSRFAHKGTRNADSSSFSLRASGNLPIR